MEYNVKYPHKEVFGLYKAFHKEYKGYILKFNLYCIRYVIPKILNDGRYIIDITKCTDYKRYKKIYRLLYGI